ncbi:MAG TPA: hypothetical protein VLB81_04435 [Gaiellales bacterium]|nr:hypothetical protein [Gaiellales bacterium]
MSAAAVVDVLDRLDKAGIEWWVEGGSGVDALLGAHTGTTIATSIWAVFIAVTANA